MRLSKTTRHTRFCACPIMVLAIGLICTNLCDANQSARQRSGKAGQKAGRAKLGEQYVLPIRREFEVNQVSRQALMFIPKSALRTPTPVVFVFHGSGATVRDYANKRKFHTLWPNAIWVYPQGLPRGEGKQPDKTVWRIELPGAQGNPDIEFFDHMLSYLKHEFRLDEQRIYASGNSNGGFFTYLLWHERADIFAALGPSACFSKFALSGLKPLPVYHVAGRKDDKVPFWKQSATIADIKVINKCGEAVKLPARGCTRFPSEAKAPLVTFIHPGGHDYPDAAGPMLVRFLKQHQRKSR